MRLSFVLFALAACSSPSPVTPDGARARPDSPRAPDAAGDAPSRDAPPAADLACLGQAPPSTAPDPLALDGKVFGVDHYALSPFAGAVVTLHRRSDDAVLVTSLPSGTDGTYELAAATGGDALDAYFTITATGMLPVRVDPGDPLTTGYYALAVVAASDEVARWYADAGAAYSSDARTLISVAVDCDEAAIDGATIAIAPSAQVTYYDSAASRWNPAATSSTNGFALVTGGAATESATVGWLGTTFPAHAATAPAGTVTLAVASPHATATD
jgi:hypothetical protein